jgi:hypothetical protein
MTRIGEPLKTYTDVPEPVKIPQTEPKPAPTRIPSKEPEKVPEKVGKNDDWV